MIRANTLFYRIIKTAGDYIFAVIFLMVVSPLILFLSILIFLTGGWPVIYSQKRTGLNGKPFSIYKFRSLRQGTSEGIQLISDSHDVRITKIGRVMRRYRLDEIPNFINVLKGEMSIVGPRPEQEYFIEKLIHRNPKFTELLKVKPGVTSWGEVKYGYASDVDQMVERLEFDLYYLKNKSLAFDMRILLETAWIVFKGRGI